MKQVFLSGDDTYPLYHPIAEIRKELYQIFDAEPFSVALDSEHFEGMEAGDLARYDLIVMYNDHWNDKVQTSHQLAQAFVHYVAEGGNLLVLHNPDMGILPELAQMIGCMPMHPLEKPRMEVLRFFAADHPAVFKELEFTVEEEIFGLYYSPLTQRQLLLTAQMPDGTVLQAGWTVEFGKGKTAWISPGHSDVWKQKAYQDLVGQTARWMTGD